MKLSLFERAPRHPLHDGAHRCGPEQFETTQVKLVRPGLSACTNPNAECAASRTPDFTLTGAEGRIYKSGNDAKDKDAALEDLVVIS